LTGAICYIGIGSNIGDALQNCKHAIEILSRKSGIKLVRYSSFYKSEPVGIENQEWFVNTVVEIETTFFVHQLMNILKDIEKEMGRTREIKGGPRIIDLDLLFYNHDILNEPDLIVPHPELHKRNFVLKPLGEIASYLFILVSVFQSVVSKSDAVIKKLLNTLIRALLLPAVKYLKLTDKKTSARQKRAVKQTEIFYDQDSSKIKEQYLC